MKILDSTIFLRVLIHLTPEDLTMYSPSLIEHFENLSEGSGISSIAVRGLNL